MVTRDDSPRWGQRVLAPLAFFTAATILVLLVHNSLSAEPETRRDNSPGAATGTVAGGTTTRTGNTTKRAGGGQRRFYRVRSGDTLERIAARYDTTVADLVELNPNVDPNALTVGQRIRVR